MVLTRLAVLFATSLADWTKCLLAAGLGVLEEAKRHALHRAEVCFATMVAADNTCRAERWRDTERERERETERERERHRERERERERETDSGLLALLICLFTAVCVFSAS